MRNSSKYMRKYGLSYIAAFLLVAMEAVGDLLQPTLLSRMIDDGVSKLNQTVVLHFGGLMLLVTAAGALAASGRNVVSSQVSQRFGSELRSDLYGHIQSLPLGNIDKFDRAGLVTRLTNDVTQLQNFVNGMMRIFAKAPILCIGSLVMAIRLNPTLSLVLVAVVPIVAILIFFNLRIGFPMFLRVQRSMDKLNGIMREYLSGVRVVKAFNRFAGESEKFARINDEYRRSSVNALRRMAVFNPAILLTVNFGIVAVMWLGAIRVNGHHMQVGHIVAFVNYMTQILFSLMMISMVFNMLVRAKASYGRISEVMAVEPDMTWTEGVGADARSEGRIDFDHVSFSYHGEDGVPALKDIDLTILPGQTVGIIGSTGSGKSTLVGLVMRFYDATGGSVRLDGTDVREIDPSIVRAKAAIVPQKAMLFSGTIMDNIRWGKEDATEEEVIAAARMAAAHDFISALPEGYQTKLGQGGVNLSGGQKQRVSIARALVRQPRILILDDCTSAVDVATEASIKQALRDYAQHLTCLLIAQRITSVMDADRIVVLDGGEVAGFGTHESLMRDCVVYQEIYRSQIGKEMNHDGATA